MEVGVSRAAPRRATWAQVEHRAEGDEQTAHGGQEHRPHCTLSFHGCDFLTQPRETLAAVWTSARDTGVMLRLGLTTEPVLLVGPGPSCSPEAPKGGLGREHGSCP